MGDKLDLAKFKLDVGAVRVRVDPPAEWAQMLDEAWRINRDYFYDPGFHGADWPALRQKYAAFVPDLATRNDLSRVTQWMLSELVVGHSYQSPGDSIFEAETVPGGLLGADYEVSERSLPLQEGLRRPQLDARPALAPHRTRSGRPTRAEYLLAVEGKELRYPDDLYERFERTAKRLVEITVGPTPDGKGARTVKVVPLEDERVAAQPRLGRGQPAPRHGGHGKAASPTSTSPTPPTPATPTSSATSSPRPTVRR